MRPPSQRSLIYTARSNGSELDFFFAPLGSVRRWELWIIYSLFPIRTRTTTERASGTPPNWGCTAYTHTATTLRWGGPLQRQKPQFVFVSVGPTTDAVQHKMLRFLSRQTMNPQFIYRRCFPSLDSRRRYSQRRPLLRPLCGQLSFYSDWRPRSFPPLSYSFSLHTFPCFPPTFGWTEMTMQQCGEGMITHHQTASRLALTDGRTKTSPPPPPSRAVPLSFLRSFGPLLFPGGASDEGSARPIALAGGPAARRG